MGLQQTVVLGPGYGRRSFSDRPILLFSGGLDSYLGAVEEPNALLLFIDTGVPYAWADRTRAEHLAAVLNRDLYVLEGVLDFADFASPMIPNRNLLLLSVAAQMSDHIMMCGVHEDLTRDGSRRFYRQAARAIGTGQGTRVKITNPLHWRSKPQAVRRYLKRGGNVHALLKTRSCYHRGDGHCGACDACMKRYIAFHANNITEHYGHDPREYMMSVLDETQPSISDVLHLGPRYLYQAAKALEGV